MNEVSKQQEKITKQIDQLELEKPSIIGPAIYLGIVVIFSALIIPILLLFHAIPLIVIRFKKIEKINLKIKRLNQKKLELTVNNF